MSGSTGDHSAASVLHGGRDQAEDDLQRPRITGPYSITRFNGAIPALATGCTPAQPAVIASMARSGGRTMCRLPSQGWKMMTFPTARSLEAARTQGYNLAKQVIERAKRQGTLREDSSPEDLIFPDGVAIGEPSRLDRAGAPS